MYYYVVNNIYKFIILLYIMQYIIVPERLVFTRGSLYYIDNIE